MGARIFSVAGCARGGSRSSGSQTLAPAVACGAAGAKRNALIVMPSPSVNGGVMSGQVVGLTLVTTDLVDTCGEQTLGVSFDRMPVAGPRDRGRWTGCSGSVPRIENRASASVCCEALRGVNASASGAMTSDEEPTRTGNEAEARVAEQPAPLDASWPLRHKRGAARSADRTRRRPPGGHRPNPLPCARAAAVGRAHRLDRPVQPDVPATGTTQVLHRPLDTKARHKAQWGPPVTDTASGSERIPRRRTQPPRVRRRNAEEGPVASHADTSGTEATRVASRFRWAVTSPRSATERTTRRETTGIAASDPHRSVP